MTALAQSKSVRELSRAYRDRVAALPCCMCGAESTSEQRSEVHHRTGAGMALKANDTDSMPLCAWCHRHFHALTGPFRGWVKSKLREWQTRMVRQTKATLLPAVRKVF
jgi:hypothetical protein